MHGGVTPVQRRPAHRHIAEIEQETGATVTFTPHLLPTSRGLLVTAYVRLRRAAAGRPRRAVRRAATPASRSSASARCPRRSGWRARTPVAVAAFADERTGTRDRRRRARQPRQGRGRPGDPERQPDARPRRGRRPDRRTACGRRRHLPARLPGRGRAGGIKASGPARRRARGRRRRPPRPPASSRAAPPPARRCACAASASRASAGRARGDRRLERQRERRHRRAGPRRRRADGGADRRADRAPADDVLVCSTGVIGVPLPMDRVEAGIRAAAACCRRTAATEAAVAICTTDSHPKLAHAHASRSTAARCASAAMAKGAGMIRPDLGTMIAVVTTDAAIARRPAAAAAGAAAAASLQPHHGRRQPVDVRLRDRARRRAPPAWRSPRPNCARVQRGAVRRLPRPRARDRRRRRGRAPDRALRGGRRPLRRPRPDRAARHVAEDQLVRCALYGADPNWGRIVAALGVCGVDLDTDRIAIDLGGVPLVRDGIAVAGAAAAAGEAAQRAARCDVRIDLGCRRRRPPSSTGSDLSTRVRPQQLGVHDLMQPVVAKLGGNALGSLPDALALGAGGRQLVIVHGGGAQISGADAPPRHRAALRRRPPVHRPAVAGLRAQGAGATSPTSWSRRSRDGRRERRAAAPRRGAGRPSACPSSGWSGASSAWTTAPLEAAWAAGGVPLIAPARARRLRPALPERQRRRRRRRRGGSRRRRRARVPVRRARRARRGRQRDRRDQRVGAAGRDRRHAAEAGGVRHRAWPPASDACASAPARW